MQFTVILCKTARKTKTLSDFVGFDRIGRFLLADCRCPNFNAVRGDVAAVWQQLSKDFWGFGIVLCGKMFCSIVE